MMGGGAPSPMGGGGGSNQVPASTSFKAVQSAGVSAAPQSISFKAVQSAGAINYPPASMSIQSGPGGRGFGVGTQGVGPQGQVGTPSVSFNRGDNRAGTTGSFRGGLVSSRTGIRHSSGIVNTGGIAPRTSIPGDYHSRGSMHQIEGQNFNNRMSIPADYSQNITGGSSPPAGVTAGISRPSDLVDLFSGSAPGGLNYQHLTQMGGPGAAGGPPNSAGSGGPGHDRDSLRFNLFQNNVQGQMMGMQQQQGQPGSARNSGAVQGIGGGAGSNRGSLHQNRASIPQQSQAGQPRTSGTRTSGSGQVVGQQGAGGGQVGGAQQVQQERRSSAEGMVAAILKRNQAERKRSLEQ